jgi:hypothetical protein
VSWSSRPGSSAIAEVIPRVHPPSSSREIPLTARQLPAEAPVSKKVDAPPRSFARTA